MKYMKLHTQVLRVTLIISFIFSGSLVYAGGGGDGGGGGGGFCCGANSTVGQAVSAISNAISAAISSISANSAAINAARQNVMSVNQVVEVQNPTGSVIGRLSDGRSVYSGGANGPEVQGYGDGGNGGQGEGGGGPVCNVITVTNESTRGSCVGIWSNWQAYSQDQERRVLNGTQVTTARSYSQTTQRSYPGLASCSDRTITQNGTIPGGASPVNTTVSSNVCQQIEYRDIENPAVVGCMDPNASNYNSDATVDDGARCTYGSRKPGVTNTPPYIVLDGSNYINLPQDVPYTEPGYAAYDQEDGNITSDVVVTGSVDASKVGQYILRYNVKDSNDASAPEQTRRVNIFSYVVECPSGQSPDPDTGACAFDSCPSGYTMVGGTCELTALINGEVNGTMDFLCSLDQDWSDSDNSCSQEFALGRKTQPIYLQSTFTAESGCVLQSVSWALNPNGNDDPQFGFLNDSDSSEVGVIAATEGSVSEKFHNREVTLTGSPTPGCVVAPSTKILKIKMLEVDIVEE